jgi:hypothetical protein
MPVVLAPLVPIVIALVAVILLYAFYQLFHPILAGLANNVPTVGGLIARALDAAISWAYQTVLGWVRGAIRPIISFILAPVFWIEQHISEITNTLNAVMLVQAYGFNQLLPRAIGGALNEAHGWVVGAENYTTQAVGQLRTWTAGELTSLQRYTEQGLAADAAYAASLFHAAEQYTQAGLAAQNSYVQSAISGLEAYTQHGLEAGLAYTRQLVGDAENYTRSLVGSAVGAIDTDLGNITRWAQGEFGSLATAIAASQAFSIAFARAAAGTVEADLGRLKTECTDNLCSGLGDLASLFNALTGDLGLAGLFALAGEFARDPKGAAADVEGVFGPVARAASDSIRSLINVA